MHFLLGAVDTLPEAGHKHIMYAPGLALVGLQCSLHDALLGSQAFHPIEQGPETQRREGQGQHAHHHPARTRTSSRPLDRHQRRGLRGS